MIQNFLLEAYFLDNVIIVLRFKIDTGVQRLQPKEIEKVCSKRFGGYIFRKFHCSGRSTKKYEKQEIVVTSIRWEVERGEKVKRNV